MTNILLYIPPPYKISGGLGNFKLFFDICKELGYSIYYCPLLKNISSLNFNTVFNNRNINSITHKELIDYYNDAKDCEDINITDIVTPTILMSRNNVVIYPEDILGNPAEQKYIVRWLFYFPIPEAVKMYNFNNDYICFYSDYIFNFYKYVCIACGIEDLLTNKIKNPNICRVFKFEPKLFNSIKNTRKINTNQMTNNKSFTIRKFFPPCTFSRYNVVNAIYAQNILTKHKNLIHIKIEEKRKNKSKIEKLNLQTQIDNLNKNKPDIFDQNVIRTYLTNKFKNEGYTLIEHKNSSDEFVDFFLKKDLFLSFDPFTFMNIIASLCGCISIIKKINGLNFKEWVNGEPFNKYGIAYGQEGIEHALETQHLLLPHITEMYNQNTNNVLNLITNIETQFNIKINKI